MSSLRSSSNLTVGSLIYIMRVSRPDIAEAVGEVSRYLSSPDMTHMQAVLRIIKYLKKTMDYGLILSGDCSLPTTLTAWSDASYAEDPDTRRSTTGWITFVGGNVISFKSQRQPLVTLSTTEAEYVALCSTVQEVCWLRQVLDDIGFTQEGPTVIHEDNQGCIMLSTNDIISKRTKHIEVRLYFVKELVQGGVIALAYTPTKDMIADVFTKALSRDQFERFRNEIGVHPITFVEDSWATTQVTEELED